MARKPRQDEPGALFHIWNRGVAQRSVFEGRREVRYFQARLARAVRKGLIEVIAFSFQLNHFHLVVRSPAGEMGRAMRLVESMFVRKFNPPRNRDGPLFRARYGSARILSLRYLLTVICYTDQNCVRGGLALDPADFEFGSAWHYSRGCTPLWLARGFMEDLLRSRLEQGLSLPEAYKTVFGRPLTSAEQALVERRMIYAADHPDPLDDLIGAALPRTREWLIRQASLADGTVPGLVILAPESLIQVIEDTRAGENGLTVRLARNALDPWPILLAGLLRGMCGASLLEAATWTGTARSTVSDNAARHRRLLQSDVSYGDLAARILSRALAVTFPEI